MKALSLKQPWASLIASGQKTIETRVWSTEYRGDLLICSSKTIDKASMSYFDGLFSEVTLDEIPVGVALCIAELYDCKPMTTADEEKAMCNVYGEGRWKARSFFLRNIRPVEPFPVHGQLGIFEVNIDESKIIYK